MLTFAFKDNKTYFGLLNCKIVKVKVFSCNNPVLVRWRLED